MALLLDQKFMPKEAAKGIWDNSVKQSLVATIAPSTPMIFGQNDFAYFSADPAAEIVGENKPKSATDAQIDVKTSRMFKVHVGLPVSIEFAQANPLGVLDLLGEKLSAAIARQLDLLVLHGRMASTGATVAGAEYVNQTSNRITIPATAPANGFLADLVWDAAEAVFNTSHRNVQALAIDPSLAFRLGRERDGNGNAVTAGIDLTGGPTSLFGLNTAVSRSVSGALDASVDTKVRAITGDWSALKWGYAADLGLEKLTAGDPFGTGDLGRYNMVGYRAEAFISYAIMDTDAFAVLENAPTP